ncbi:Palmitoyl-protein thioesterase 1 [Gurleya vavrai]
MGKNKIIDCLLWSDPRDNIIHKLSDRGLGIFWTDTITKIFLKENNLELIVRSHEKCTIGRSFIFDKKVITVFSAPNYMNSKNLAAYLVIQKDFIKTGQEICDEKTRIIDAKDSMNCNGFSYYFETFEEWSFDYVENLKGFSLTR